MKPNNDKSTYIQSSTQRSNERDKTVNENSDSITRLLLPEEDAEHPRGGTTEENRFDILMQMSRDLAHQLNNHLTAILANAQLALLMAENEELKSYLDAVEEATGEAGTAVHRFQETTHALVEQPTLEKMPGKIKRSNH